MSKKKSKPNDQKRFKNRLIREYKSCVISGLADMRFLVASHIKPKSECLTKKEKYDQNNGLLLLPHLDHLFDHGFISFTDDGHIMIAADMPDEMAALYEVYPSIAIDLKTDERRKYMDYHRKNVFEKRYQDVFGK